MRSARLRRTASHTGQLAGRSGFFASPYGLRPGCCTAGAGLPTTASQAGEGEACTHAALRLAVIFIDLIRASQLGSVVQSIAIMASLPRSLIGAFLALLLARSSLNIFSIIGFPMRMGLGTQKAILLVHFTHRSRPKPRTPTALAEGSEPRSPMPHAVISGLITSTRLTRVVVPVIYTDLDDLGACARRPREPRARVQAAPPIACP